MSLYEEIILDDSGLRVDPKRKNVIDQLLKLINQISIADIEDAIENIKGKLTQFNFSALPAELKQKIIGNLDYKSLSRMRQVDKTSKVIADSNIQKNVTEQISIELLDKIICLPYYLNWLIYRYVTINQNMNISGWKDITITGDKLDGKFVGLVKINGMVHIDLSIWAIDAVVKGEGYFDSTDKPHFKLVLDGFQVPGFLFWNEDNRYIYCDISGNDVRVDEVKRMIYPDRLRMLYRHGVIEDQRTFHTNFKDDWTTDFVRFVPFFDDDAIYEAQTFDYEIINVTLPDLGNKIAMPLVNEE